MFKRILLPTDGSAASDKATIAAVELAKALNAEVHALTIIKPLDFWSSTADDVTPPIATPEFFDVQREKANANLKKVHDACANAGVNCTSCLRHDSKPWRVIIELAEKLNVDLIVIGSRGHRGFASWILGNEAERVLTNTDVPVLVIRADK